MHRASVSSGKAASKARRGKNCGAAGATGDQSSPKPGRGNWRDRAGQRSGNAAPCPAASQRPQATGGTRGCPLPPRAPRSRSPQLPTAAPPAREQSALGRPACPQQHLLAQVDEHPGGARGAARAGPHGSAANPPRVPLATAGGNGAASGGAARAVEGRARLGSGPRAPGLGREGKLSGRRVRASPHGNGSSQLD